MRYCFFMLIADNTNSDYFIDCIDKINGKVKIKPSLLIWITCGQRKQTPAMPASFFGHKKTSKPNDLKVLLARSTCGYHRPKIKAGYAGYLASFRG